MKIVKLEADNVKRLRAVEITPSGELVVIGGRNAQGKSSILDAIEMALGGGRAQPPKPVRAGETAAHIVVDLGDIIVTRTIDAGGKTALKVQSRDGATYSSPQTMLDKLVGRLSFDPLEFSRMDEGDQHDVLCKLAGLDLAAFEREHDKHFDARTEVNRTVKQLEGQLAGMPHHPDAPAEEVSIAGLGEQLRAAQDAKAKAQHARSYAQQCDTDASGCRRAVENLQVRIGELQQEIECLQREVERLQREVLPQCEKNLEDAVARFEDALDSLTAADAAVPDTDALHEQLAAAGGVNERVRANAQRAGVQAKLDEARAQSERLTRDIEAANQTKLDAIAAAPFPVPGLSVTDTGVTLNGLPFEQASQAERLRASVAIGLAMNPKLRVLLVRDGSWLDTEGMRLLAELAAQADAQVWVERVTDDADGCTVLIEDGAVASPAAECAAE